MKLGKLSLAAIVAVTGLTTVASASSLTEAIQGATINGFVRYRLTDKTNEVDQHWYKGAFKVNVPINEALTLKTKILTSATLNGQGATGTEAKGAPTFWLADVYGVFSGVENLTLQVGRQPIPGPFTDNGATGGDQDHRGTGVVGLYNAGPVTLAAGAFTATNAKVGATANIQTQGSDIYEVGAIGSFAGINAQAWYVNVNVDNNITGGGDKKVNGFSVLLDGSFDLDSVKLTPFAAYTSLDKGDLGLNTQKQARAGATVGISGINLTAAYAVNGADGGDIVFGDGDATANFSTGVDGQGQVDLSTLAGDTKAIYVAASSPITDTISGQVEYVTASDAAGKGKDAAEIMGSLIYNMSKNMRFLTFYSNLDVDGTKTDMFRFEAKYKF